MRGIPGTQLPSSTHPAGNKLDHPLRASSAARLFPCLSPQSNPRWAKSAQGAGHAAYCPTGHLSAVWGRDPLGLPAGRFMKYTQFTLGWLCGIIGWHRTVRAIAALIADSSQWGRRGRRESKCCREPIFSVDQEGVGFSFVSASQLSYRHWGVKGNHAELRPPDLPMSKG